MALDEELVARCQAGDTLAFRELFRLHKTNVARLVQRMNGRSTEVDDLVQEVFLQVHRSIGDFRGKSRFSTWLYRVTVNVVLMHRRAAKSRPTLVEQPETMVPEAREPLPDELASRAARVRVFAQLLEQLSEKKRTVFILHELEGMGASEIADVVEAPVLTVRTRLFYARRELEALIRNEPALASVLAELEGSANKVREAGQ
ncbi:MAG: sigma-70 family RNA polymerase sigma factor [Polyangiaceae bacterium]